MLAQALVTIVLPLLLLAAAGFDLASFTIPNWLNLAAAALFVPFALAAGFTLPLAGWHLLAGLAGLLLGFALFVPGWIGGGDAKLFAALALWLGFSDFTAYVLAASIFGGLLTLGVMLARQCPLPAGLARQSWIARLHSARSGIPYGVALALGAFAVLPHSAVFRQALGA